MKRLNGLFSASGARRTANGSGIDYDRFHAETTRVVGEASRDFGRWVENTTGIYSAAIGGFEAGQAAARRPGKAVHCCNCGAPLVWAATTVTTCSYCKSEHHA